MTINERLLRALHEMLLWNDIALGEIKNVEVNLGTVFFEVEGSRYVVNITKTEGEEDEQQ